MTHYTYILKCADGTLYTGYTNDLDKRLAAHNSGKGAKYTKTRLPVELIYHEDYASKEEAMSREWHIKHDLTRDGKLALVDAANELKPLTDECISYITELFEGHCDGHDVDHSLRVYRNAMRIARLNGGCDLTVVALAALLHDADDHKLFKTTDNANARAFLSGRVAQDKIDQIIEVINGVSFSRNRGRKPATVEGCVVQDADRLDAMGALGIARTFAYGGKKGRPMKDSVAHFYDKLLLLKDEMNTPAALKMAEERHAFLQAFLDELDREKI